MAQVPQPCELADALLLLPFLISYALIDPTQRRVITAEVSRPSAQRANRKVPNVCQTLGVKSLTIFDLIEELDFTTGWQRRAAPPKPL